MPNLLLLPGFMLNTHLWDDIRDDLSTLGQLYFGDLGLDDSLDAMDPVVTKAAVAVNQGKQATGLPKWQAKLGAEWDVNALSGLTLTANATTASKQYLSADNTLSVPGRTVFDMGARYATKVSGRPLTLRAAVNNLTNKAYWAKPNFTSIALGAPRTFLLSATMDF